MYKNIIKHILCCCVWNKIIIGDMTKCITLMYLDAIEKDVYNKFM